MKLRRFLIRIFLYVTGGALFLYILLATSLGLRLITQAVAKLAPGVQEIRVEGSSIRSFQIEKLNFRNENVAVQIKQAMISWHPRALLKGKLDIQRLHVVDVTLELLDHAKKENAKETDWTWLNAIWIRDILIKKITLIPSDAQLQLQGKITDRWDLKWQIRLHNKRSTVREAVSNKTPRQILRSLHGDMVANGVMQGAKLAPKITANIHATDLAWLDWQAKKLQVATVVALQSAEPAVLLIRADDLRYDRYLFKTLALQAKGQIYSQLALRWQLQAQLISEEDYRGAIVIQGMIGGDYLTPKLAAKINVTRAQAQAVQLDKLEALLNADWKSDGISTLKITVDGLKIKEYEFSPIHLQFTLNRAKQLLLTQLSQGFLRYSAGDELRTLNWQNSELTITQQADDLLAQGRLTLNAQQYLTLNLRLPHYQFLEPLSPEQPLQGQISLYIQPLAPFLGDISEVQNVKGSMRADLIIAGNYAKPQLLGKLNLMDASADIPLLNLQIRNIQLTAQGNPTGSIQWKGQAQSGQGMLYLDGNTDLRAKDFPTVLSLTGKNILVSNTEHYRILVTPDLQVNYTDKKLNVSGVIVVPDAAINLGNNDQEVTLSKDVVFIGEKKPAAVLPLYAQIQLKLGDAVHVRYEGLTTLLRGQVLINEAPNRMALGSGQFNFYQGKYTYYGQELTLRKGSRLIFNGPVDNPTLSIQAIRQVDAVPTAPSVTANSLTPTSADLSSTVVLPGESRKIIVGVSVRGAANNPQISLFSEPAVLDQTNILSYLVLGQPSDQLSATSAATLFTAVSSLNSGGGNSSQLKDIVQNLQKSVGLDQLSIQSSSYYNPSTSQTQQNTALVLGKMLSPKLYISYSIGILEALNALRIRYALSKYWTLQSTTTSLGNGVDVLYMLERGR